MAQRDTPTLLTVGIVLQALHALGALGLIALAAALGGGVLGIGAAQEPSAIAPISFVLALGGTVLFLFAAFYIAFLVVCRYAWAMNRPALWALIVFSLLGLVNSGPISVLIGVGTIVGALQALEVVGRAEGGRPEDAFIRG